MRLDPGRFGKPDWNPPAGLPPWFLSGFVPGMLLRPVLCPFRSCSWSAKPGCPAVRQIRFAGWKSVWSDYFPGDIDRLRVVGLLQGGNQKRQLIDHQLSFNLLILSLIFDKFFLVLSVSKRNRPWADVDEPAISLHGYPVSVSTSLLRFLIFPRHYKILQDFS